MKANSIVSLVLSVLINSVCAQMSPINKYVRATTAISQLSNNNTLKGGDIIYQIPSGDVPQVIGNPYFDEKWSASSINLYDNQKLLEGYFVRFNIVNYEFEIKTKSGIGILSGSRVRDIVLIDSVTRQPRVLVNFKEISDSDEKIKKGFYELLEDGKFKLFKQTEIEILQPTYNVALNVGSKDFKILRKVRYYFTDASNNTRIVKRKSLEKDDSVRSFSKREKLDFENEQQLIKLFKFMNTDH